ncbi:MAG: outer membrane protein [Vicinamibacterales bacterium]
MAAVAAALIVSVPAASHAEGIIGAFLGTTFGEQNTGANTESHRPLLFGGVLGGVQPRGVGFEIDFGHSPDFFGTEEAFNVKTSITTLMGNLVIGGGGAPVAPFVSGGIGLIRANVSDAGDLISNPTRNDFGMNIGGGANIMLGSSVGVRGDLRYFRSFRDEDSEDGILDLGIDLSDFSFWRGTAGVVLRW